MNLPEYESLLRLLAFAIAFLLLALWERLAPRRTLSLPQVSRWLHNLALLLLNVLLLRLLFPMAAVGAAYWANTQHWGLFNVVACPEPIAFICSLILLDAIIYGQHVLFHAVPLLWRIHRVHHADLDFDLTTGLRFHPLEMVLSMLIKFGGVLLLGAPVLAVLVFEIALNVVPMFNHSNIRLSPTLDKLLRLLIVTPDMHRVHHSTVDSELNCNFGFNLSCWDRLFGNYRAQPAAGHTGMSIGLDSCRQPQQANRLQAMLLLPLAKLQQRDNETAKDPKIGE